MLPLLEPAHLDRDFDYLVPAEMDEIAQPGVRVRVRFSGRVIDGYILERLEKTDHTGRLVRLDRVVSSERVLTPEILTLVTAVAARYAGTRADVLRLAIPPRHAKVESEGPEGSTKVTKARKSAAKRAPSARAHFQGDPEPVLLDEEFETPGDETPTAQGTSAAQSGAHPPAAAAAEGSPASAGTEGPPASIPSGGADSPLAPASAPTGASGSALGNVAAQPVSNAASVGSGATASGVVPPRGHREPGSAHASRGPGMSGAEAANAGVDEDAGSRTVAGEGSQRRSEDAGLKPVSAETDRRADAVSDIERSAGHGSADPGVARPGGQAVVGPPSAAHEPGHDGAANPDVVAGVGSSTPGVDAIDAGGDAAGSDVSLADAARDLGQKPELAETEQFSDVGGRSARSGRVLAGGASGAGIAEAVGGAPSAADGPAGSGGENPEAMSHVGSTPSRAVGGSAAGVDSSRVGAGEGLAQSVEAAETEQFSDAEDSVPSEGVRGGASPTVVDEPADGAVSDVEVDAPGGESVRTDAGASGGESARLDAGALGSESARVDAGASKGESARVSVETSGDQRVRAEAAAADGEVVGEDSAGGGESVAVGEPGVDVAALYPGWGRYVHGHSFLGALAAGRGPRAGWQALPGEEWATRLAELAATTVGSGRSAILMVPDQRDLERVLAECVALVGESAVGLAAGLGPSARYRRWLAALRGTARVVVGTRSSVFAPVKDLGLIALWDDGDDTYAEPRSPYPHAREVAMLRAHETGAAFVAGGFARTAEVQAIVESGWAHDLLAERALLRHVMPRIIAPGDSDAALERDPMAKAIRIPGAAFLAARKALAAGEAVLVQVPRRGYIPALSCSKCRTPARCRHCNGPLALPDNSPASQPNRAVRRAAAQSEGRPGSRSAARQPAHLSDPAYERGSGLTSSRDGVAGAHSPACRWCGITEAAFRCGACGSRALRAVVIGAARTAEELGRAFPGVPVRGSGGASVLNTVPAGAQVVVSTIGAEPTVPGGYGVAMLLDGWALLGRADLRAAEDALRRWMSAAALVRPGGQAFVMADAGLPTVAALVRWDPVGHARFELDERTEVRFPPAVRLAAIDGTADSIAELLTQAKLPDQVEVLGPVPLPPGARKPFSSGDSPAEVERMILRVDRAGAAALSRALTAAQAVRSTHKSDDPLRVQIDPIDIG